jgi:hypothetical protein
MKLLTIRDLLEAVERIEHEQAAHAGGLHHIADTVDRIEQRLNGIRGTTGRDEEEPPGVRG